MQINNLKKRLEKRVAQMEQGLQVGVAHTKRGLKQASSKVEQGLSKSLTKIEGKVQEMLDAQDASVSSWTPPPATCSSDSKPAATRSESSTPSGTSSSSSSIRMTAPPAAGQKYDKVYFDKWIDSLHQQLQSQLPSFPSSSDHHVAWLASATACQSAQTALQDAFELKDKVQSQRPINPAELEAAKQLVDDTTQALADCRQTCQDLSQPLLKELDGTLLSASFDDSVLMQFVILTRFGSKRAAEWCAEDEQHNFASLAGLLSNNDLMRTLLQNGGAQNGQYGRCLELLESLLPKTQDPVLERLALAVALELADDIECFVRIPPVKKVPERVPNIDPLQRFVHYEQAYLFGELDEAFAGLTVWEMRMVVNSDAPNDELGWCRQSLMHYRPDHILSNNPQWRYCQIVKTDVPYQDPVWYKEKRTYDQILSGGGKCGPRAWYGRFVCKAFGIPTWGVRQPGHAAMSRWTTEGWMTALCLPRWEICWWDDFLWKQRGGEDFLLETQARSAVDSYRTYLQKVLRLEWMAAFHGEDGTSVVKDCIPDAKNSPWFALSLMQRRILASTANSSINENARQQQSSSTTPTIRGRLLHRVDGREVQVRDAQRGTVVIPAATCSSPNKPTNQVLFMKSFLGGQQLHLVKEAVVEYTLAPDLLTDKTTKYHLVLQVCSVHRNHLPVRVSVLSGGTAKTVDVAIPYEMGEWVETKPIVIQLGGPKASRTAKITISRQDQQCGFALKYMKLTPLP